MWKDLKLPDGRDAGASFSSTSSSVAVPLLIAQCHLVRHQPPGRTAYGHALSLLPRDRVSGLPEHEPGLLRREFLVRVGEQPHVDPGIHRRNAEGVVGSGAVARDAGEDLPLKLPPGEKVRII